jgi:hypothetical protein
VSKRAKARFAILALRVLMLCRAVAVADRPELLLQWGATRRSPWWKGLPQHSPLSARLGVGPAQPNTIAWDESLC